MLYTDDQYDLMSISIKVFYSKYVSSKGYDNNVKYIHTENAL